MTNFLAARVNPLASANVEFVTLYGGLVTSTPVTIPSSAGNAGSDIFTTNRIIKALEPAGVALFVTVTLTNSASIFASFDEGTTWSEVPITRAGSNAAQEFLGFVPVTGTDNKPYIIWAAGSTGRAYVHNSGFAASGSITTVTPGSYTDGQTFELIDSFGNAETFEFDTGGGVTPGNTAVDISAAVSSSDVRDAIIMAVNGVGGLEITATNGGTSIVTLAQNISGASGNTLIATTGSPPGTFTRFSNGGFREFGVSLGLSGGRPHCAIAYKGRAYWYWRGAGGGTPSPPQFYRYDPVTNTSTTQTVGITTTRSVATFFTLDQRLFCVAGDQSPDPDGLRLYELQFGSWVVLQAGWVSYISNSTASASGQITAVSLPNDTVLLLGPGNNGSGFGLEAALVSMVAGVPTPVRKTDVTVPLSLRGPSAIGNPDAFSVRATVDTQETPGTPRIYVWFSANGEVVTQVLELFELDYSDPSNPVLVDIGATEITGEYSLCTEPMWGDGAGYFTPGEFAIQILETAEDTQGMRIYYRCSGDPGNANKIVSFKFRTKFGTPTSVCTLVPGSAIGGGIISGNTITNIDADPTITHEIVWDFTNDGQLNVRYCHLQGFITS